MTTLTHSLSKVKTISLALPEVNWRRFYIIGVLMTISLIFLSLLFYVFGVNELTKGSYLIKNYQKEITKLSEENARLEMSFAEISFLENVQEKARELSFEKTKSVKYIQVVGGELVSAKK
jgi:cell division protein FtsB